MLKVWFIWEMGERSNQQLGRGCLHRDITGSFAKWIFKDFRSKPETDFRVRARL